ncbi:AraC family transcriptional regulator [Zunongwangia endophytica]|uniref:Helix-turn-helix domain-containing protein n=1 Tax=Zunongwangia endophytica TaxID=1808945 RepID=A0ABV8H666_9FLAO|nr:helix-turn-helix domain-containing protein [Zunongwangia endophytica]MDN3595153.1 helix-turn-helix domain-containing protein [Zunongwangia endophytica]
MNDWKPYAIKEYDQQELHLLRGNRNFLEGFSIFEESHLKGEASGFTFPFRTNHHLIILLLKGKVKLELNLNTHILEPNDLISVSGHMVTQSIDFLEDSKAIILTFTKNFALKNTLQSRTLESFKLLSSTNSKKVSLNADELEIFISIATYLRLKTKNIDEDHIEHKIIHAFNLIFYELRALYEKQHPLLPIEISRKEELSANFINSLKLHIKEERSVLFYADKLNVTPGHLTKMLKSISGKTARQLIDEAVILEAKILLENRSLSIAQITEALNFSDQSFFGKYFKKATGHSPSAYRNNLAQG